MLYRRAPPFRSSIWKGRVVGGERLVQHKGGKPLSKHNFDHSDNFCSSWTTVLKAFYQFQWWCLTSSSFYSNCNAQSLHTILFYQKDYSVRCRQMSHLYIAALFEFFLFYWWMADGRSLLKYYVQQRHCYIDHIATKWAIASCLKASNSMMMLISKEGAHC